MERTLGGCGQTWMRWERRNDLLDDVIAKGADFTVRFIKNVGIAKGVYLLHSSIREKKE